MTLSDIKWGSVAILVLALVITGLVVAVKIQHSTNATLTAEKQQAEQGKAIAEAITGNVITAINLINDISRATHEQKTTVAGDAGDRVVSIRNQLSTDACANTHIDSSAVEQLRQYADGLRKTTLRPAQ